MLCKCFSATEQLQPILSALSLAPAANKKENQHDRSQNEALKGKLQSTNRASFFCGLKSYKCRGVALANVA